MTSPTTWSPKKNIDSRSGAGDNLLTTKKKAYKMDKIISETLEKEKYLSERDVMRLAILRDEKLVLTGRIDRLVVIRDEINQEIKEIREGVLDE